MDTWLMCAGEQVELAKVPKEIKILPLGKVHSQKGDFQVDKESIELIIKQFKERKLDLVIDYEHQTLSDTQAPAGGWVKELYPGEDALMAKVEWTPKAREYLENKEYRYLSPVVLVRKRDKKAVTLHSAALTNTPAIDGMFAIVNSLDIEKSKGGQKMDWKELAEALGLSETASEEEIKRALTAAVKAKEELKALEEEKPGEPENQSTEPVANSTILAMLGLKAEAKTEEVAAAIMSLKAGGVDTQKEILALKQQMKEKAADELVEKALKAGKISAAQKEWAQAYALKDESGFRKFMEIAPSAVPTGKMDLKDAPETRMDDLDAVILKNCGIGEEDIQKYGKWGV